MPEQGGGGADRDPRGRDAAPGLITALALCVAGALLLTFSGRTAVGLAGLAGAGALVAVKGLARRVAGLALVGVGLVSLWPGLAFAAAGALAAARGQCWPALGARYERDPRDDDAWAALDRGEDPTDTI